jgi:hypothetical protein
MGSSAKPRDHTARVYAKKSSPDGQRMATVGVGTRGGRAGSAGETFEEEVSSCGRREDARRYAMAGS